MLHVRSLEKGIQGCHQSGHRTGIPARETVGAHQDEFCVLIAQRDGCSQEHPEVIDVLSNDRSPLLYGRGKDHRIRVALQLCDLRYREDIMASAPKLPRDA